VLRVGAVANGRQVFFRFRRLVAARHQGEQPPQRPRQPFHTRDVRAVMRAGRAKRNAGIAVDKLLVQPAQQAQQQRGHIASGRERVFGVFLA